MLTPHDVIERFGGTQAATAKALGLTRAAVSQWVKRGRVPELWQYKLAAGAKNLHRLRKAA